MSKIICSFSPTNKKQPTEGCFLFVGEPGIEPGPHGPKPRTLPLCYTPNEEGNESFLSFNLRMWGESFCLHPENSAYIRDIPLNIARK